MLRRGAKRSELELGYDREEVKLHSSRAPGKRRRRVGARTWSCGLCLIVLVVFSIAWSLEAELQLAYFKWRDHSYGRPASSCRLRKPPLVYARGDSEAVVVWETTCVRPGMTLSYGSQDEQAKVVHLTVPNDPMETHHIHRATLTGLTRNEEVPYAVVDADTTSTWAKGSFVWQPSPNFNLALVSDNQYNVRTFRKILQQMRSYYGRTPPAMLVHAGDAVQNAYDLAMWQTDYSDPLHNAFSFAASGVPPVLWTPGNHDHDRTGSHPYTGGSPTYRSLSIGHTRWLVLDSNNNKTDQVEFLQRELESSAWRDASLRIILIHISPFVKYWVSRKWVPADPGQLELKSGAWTSPRTEREWGRHIRDNLAPLWHNASAPAHLVISGHSHAYSRGLLTHSAAPALLSLASSRLDEASAAVSAAKERHPTAPGTVYAITGGAGGTLDYDKVEDWGFYEASISGKYHWVDMRFETRTTLDGKETYVMGDDQTCQRADKLMWTARSIEGEVLDEFILAGRSCRSRNAS